MFACTQLTFFTLKWLTISCLGNGATYSGWVFPPQCNRDRPPQTIQTIRACMWKGRCTWGCRMWGTVRSSLWCFPREKSHPPFWVFCRLGLSPTWSSCTSWVQPTLTLQLRGHTRVLLCPVFHLKIFFFTPCMVTHACNPCTWGSEGIGLEV